MTLGLYKQGFVKYMECVFLVSFYKNPKFAISIWWGKDFKNWVILEAKMTPQTRI